MQFDVTLHCAPLQGELFVTEATVIESVSAPTRATVHVVTDEDLDGEPALGAPAHLQVSVDGTPVRHFQLVVEAVTLEGVHRGHRRRYAIELSHELSLLALRSDVRMFQEKDAVQIVSAVLQDAGVASGH